METIFKPNFEKKQFSIVIDVYENGLSFGVIPKEKSPMYYEVLGAIHQMLYSVMETQRQESKKEIKKHQKKNCITN
jgi:hypothetical protein